MSANSPFAAGQLTSLISPLPKSPVPGEGCMQKAPRSGEPLRRPGRRSPRRRGAAALDLPSRVLLTSTVRQSRSTEGKPQPAAQQYSSMGAAIFQPSRPGTALGRPGQARRSTSPKERMGSRLRAKLRSLPSAELNLGLLPGSCVLARSSAMRASSEVRLLLRMHSFSVDGPSGPGREAWRFGFCACVSHLTEAVDPEK